MPTTADSVAVADTLGTVEMPAVGQGGVVRQNAGALSALGPLGRLSPRLLAMIAAAALVAVMIMVSVSTFDWSSVRNLRSHPWTSSVVMLATVIVVVATGDLCGPGLS
jgi:hypothetical protein